MRIIWTDIARAHLLESWRYLAADNPTAADRLLGQIGSAVRQLELYPNMGRAGRIFGTRELVVLGTPFVVTYRVHADEIQVLGVLHGSRQWPDTF